MSPRLHAPVIYEQPAFTFTKKADFMLCFNDNYVCICLPDVGNSSRRIKNGNGIQLLLPFCYTNTNKFLGNEWTTMYSTFSEETPQIGEGARRDLQEHADCVIYGMQLMNT